MGYRADIDGLRAIAILLVSVFHFSLFPIGEAGFIGVDVFFVISGFLITRILATKLASGTFSLSEFYIARLRRLMPALVATLLLYLVVGLFVFLPDRFVELAIEALLSQIYIVNFYFWRSINYFGLRADVVPLLHMWSLAVEEQFYIFYPLVLAFIFRFARRALLLILVGTCLFSFALGWIATGWKPEASFYLLPTRAWELLVGGILALAAPQGMALGRLAKLAGPLGLALIVLAVVFHTPVTPFPGWFATLPVAGSALLILGGSATPTGRVLSLSPMVWIGKISYPLYLVHWPIIIVMRELLIEFSAPWRWAGFAMSILLAWAIWRFVERPIRSGHFLPTPRRFLAAAAGATFCLIAFSLAGILTKGMPYRFSPEVQSMLAYADDLPRSFIECEISEDNQTPCSLGTEGAPSVVVIGDSHGRAFAGALDIWLTESGISGELWFHHGCLPVLDVDDWRCQAFMEKALAAVAPDTVETVLIVSSWRYDPGEFKGRYLTGRDADRALREAFEATIQQFLQDKKKVIVVDPIFFATNSVPPTLARNLHFGSTWEVNRPYSEYLAVNERLFEIFADIEQIRGVQRISLIEELCLEGVCRAVINGTPVFVDKNHIRFGMSEYFANIFRSLVPLK